MEASNSYRSASCFIERTCSCKDGRPKHCDDRRANSIGINVVPRLPTRNIFARHQRQGAPQAPSPRHYQFSPRPAVTQDGLQWMVQCEPSPIERQGSPRWDIFQGGSL
ncbi:UDP-galactose transporter [Fusarium oxysporum f. sp. albedinis]|nr:UDP-galactose transporter [Fusarium oxysporum f. sp. albedinis]